jgi:hypothetical protein
LTRTNTCSAASGEAGFSTQTPEITLREIVQGGITTVVGCLGVDTTMKVIARGRQMVGDGLPAAGGRHGRLMIEERFLEENHRSVEWHGQKASRADERQ